MSSIILPTSSLATGFKIRGCSVNGVDLEVYVLPVIFGATDKAVRIMVSTEQLALVNRHRFGDDKLLALGSVRCELNKYGITAANIDDELWAQYGFAEPLPELVPIKPLGERWFSNWQGYFFQRIADDIKKFGSVMGTRTERLVSMKWFRKTGGEHLAELRRDRVRSTAPLRRGKETFYGPKSRSKERPTAPKKKRPRAPAAEAPKPVSAPAEKRARPVDAPKPTSPDPFAFFAPEKTPPTLIMPPYVADWLNGMVTNQDSLAKLILYLNQRYKETAKN